MSIACPERGGSAGDAGLDADGEMANGGAGAAAPPRGTRSRLFGRCSVRPDGISGDDVATARWTPERGRGASGSASVGGGATPAAEGATIDVAASAGVRAGGAGVAGDAGASMRWATCRGAGGWQKDRAQRKRSAARDEDGEGASRDEASTRTSRRRRPDGKWRRRAGRHGWGRGLGRRGRRALGAEAARSERRHRVRVRGQGPPRARSRRTVAPSPPAASPDGPAPRAWAAAPAGLRRAVADRR